MTSDPIIVNNGNIEHLASLNYDVKNIESPSIRPIGLSTAYITSNKQQPLYQTKTTRKSITLFSNQKQQTNAPISG